MYHCFLEEKLVQKCFTSPAFSSFAIISPLDETVPSIHWFIIAFNDTNKSYSCFLQHGFYVLLLLPILVCLQEVVLGRRDLFFVWLSHRKQNDIIHRVGFSVDLSTCLVHVWCVPSETGSYFYKILKMDNGHKDWLCFYIEFSWFTSDVHQELIVGQINPVRFLSTRWRKSADALHGITKC